MKNLVFLFVLAMTMVACTGNQTNSESESVDTVTVDTIDSICID